MNTIEDGWHILDTADVEILVESLWTTGPGRSEKRARELVEKAATSGGTSGKRRHEFESHHQAVVVTLEVQSRQIDADGVIHLTPRDASKYLGTPLKILVENALNDGAFLKILISRLAKKSTRDLFSKCGTLMPPVEFISGGGKDEAKKMLDRFSTSGDVLRLVVVLDSDALVPWLEMPDKHLNKITREIRKICDQMRVECWILHKREMENYIPGDALEADSLGDESRLKLVQLLKSFEPRQWDFFDLKKGFNSAILQEQEELYSSLSMETKDACKRGFGRKVADLLGKKHIQPHLSKDALMERSGRTASGRAEVEDIVALICRHL